MVTVMRPSRARVRKCNDTTPRARCPNCVATGAGGGSLGQERRPILLFKNEGTARAYGKRIADTFISLARNRAGLATFSIDETNDRSTWGPCLARRPSWARRSLRCDLLLFAGGESQC